MGKDKSLYTYVCILINHTCVSVYVPMCGIVFVVLLTCVPHVSSTHAYHIELVANLYHISIGGEFIEYWPSFKISLPTYS